MMRKLAIAVLALLTAPLGAQDVQYRKLFHGYDLTGVLVANRTWVALDATELPGPGSIQAATSTTVTATTAGLGTFRDVVVGDQIAVFRVQAGVTDVRIITAKASDDSITVNTAATWAASAWRYQKLNAGTGAANGWFDVAKFSQGFGIQFGVVTINATGGIQFNVQCSISDVPGGSPGAALPVTVYQGTASATFCDTGILTTAGQSCYVEFSSRWKRCRVGGYIVTADVGAQSLFADSVGVTR